MPNFFAVIGNPIEHSLSPTLHYEFALEKGLNLQYHKILGDEVRFEQQVRDFFASDGRGLNVTAPFKERAFRLAEISTSRCIQAGAANMLWMHAGKLHADNSDGVGLVLDLRKYITLEGSSILIIGAGGAVRGILPALLACNLKQCVITNRTLHKAQSLLSLNHSALSVYETHQLSDRFDLIIHATSSRLPINLPSKIFNNHPFCYDLNYDLEKDTSFVEMAKGYGCVASDGFGMLKQQALVAFNFWNF